MFDIAYIHVGLDKTGSTAIQSFLNSELVLKKNGIFYPPTLSQADNHWLFGSLFSKNKKDYIGNIDHGRSSLLSEEELLQEDSNIIVKYEDILSSSEGNILVMSYEGLYTLSREELENMIQWVSRFAKQVKCIVYCRDPISFAESAISQLVITGRRPDYENLPRQDIKNIIQRLASVFGKENIIIRKFERCDLIGNDVRSDFLHILGFDMHMAEIILKEFDIKFRKENNESLSIHGIGVAEELINFAPNITDSPLFSWRYGFLLRRFKGPKFKLTQVEKGKILKDPLVRDSLEYLSKEFGINFFLNTTDEQSQSRILYETLKKDGLYKVISELVHHIASSRVVIPKGVVDVNRVNVIAKPGDNIILEATIQNRGEEAWWTNHLWPLRGGYYIIERGRFEKEERVAEGRFAIPGGVINGRSSTRVKFSVSLPNKPGEYELIISIVQEHIAWFHMAPGNFMPARVKLLIQETK